MYSHDDIQYALETTRVLHEPDRRIDTFGTTRFDFHLLSELMDSVGRVRVRSGRIEAQRPQIVTPEHYRHLVFEGFGEQADAFAQWLQQHGANLSVLKYGFGFRKSDVREDIVNEPMEAVCERVLGAPAVCSNPLSAVIQGVDDTWEISVLKFALEMIQKSQGINIFDFKRRGCSSQPLGGLACSGADSENPTRIMGGGRFKIVFALFALAALAASVMASLYFYRNIKKAEDQVFLEIEALKVGPPPLPDPGADRYQEALELLKTGEEEAARSKLSYILRFYEDSRRYGDAKRIIGEMNLDRLLSSEPMEGKVDYTVKGGDSLLAIANRNSTTVDYILRSNNLMSTRIHPGDRLVLSPLDFAVVIDAKDETLTLTSKDEFFKEYPVRRMRLPYGVRPPFQTTVTDRIALVDDERISLTDDRIQEADKWLHTKVPGLVFGVHREKPEADGQAPEDEHLMVGVLLERPDFDELFTLLRVSTPVKVIQ